MADPQQLSDIDLAHQIASSPPAPTNDTAAAPATQPSPRQAQARGNIWKDVGVGGWEALNQVGMGLPGLIWRIANEPTYKDWEGYVNSRPLAKTIGDVAGLAGSFLIPGGAILKGGELGAKALGAAGLASRLGKLANIARTGEGAGSFARGALLGLEQGLPRSAIQGAQTSLDTGDVGKGLGQAALGAGTSALLGGGIGALAGRLGGKINPETGEKLGGLRSNLQEFANDADKNFVSRTLGVSMKDMRSASKLYGLDARENYWTDTANLLRSKGITGKAEAKDLINESGKMFQNAAAAYDKARPDLTQLIDDPQIQEIKAQYPDENTDSILRKLLRDTSLRNGFSDQKAFLSQIMERNLRNPAATGAQDAAADMAAIIKGRINDKGMDLSGQSAPEANALYHQLKPIKNALERNSISPERMTAGSDTAARMIMDSVLGGGEGAAGGMAAVPGGQIINKALAGVANKALGGVGRFIGPALRSGPAQAIAGGLESLSPALMQGAKIPGIKQGPSGQAPQAPQPSEDQVHSAAQQLSTAQASGNNQALQQQLLQAIQMEYQTNPMISFRYSFPQYAQMMGQWTADQNGPFSLSNPMTFRLLAHNKETGDKLYQAFQNYQNLKGVDLGTALSLPSGRAAGLQQELYRMFPNVAPDEIKHSMAAFDSLSGILGKVAGKDPTQPLGKEDYNNLRRQLDDIRMANIPQQDKMTALYNLFSRLDPNFTWLQRLGLAGAKNAGSE